MTSNFTVFSLGASARLIPYFLEMKRLGIKIIACDKNRKAHGRKYVDYFENVSTYDLNSCLSIASDYKKSYKSIKFIALSAGLPILNAAIIRKKVNKEKVDLQLYKSFVDKSQLRKKLRSIGYSKLRSLKTNNNYAYKFLKSVGVCVIKPNLGGMSSSWTLKVSDEKTLGNYFRKVCEASMDNNAYLEEFIKGDEYKLSTIWSDGQFKFFSLEKAVFDKELLIVCGHAIGKLENYKIYKKLQKYMSGLFRRLNMPNGPVGLDLILAKNKFEILDFEFALTDTHQLFPYISKYNVYKNEVAAILDKGVEVLKPPSDACCLRRILLPVDLKIGLKRNFVVSLVSKHKFIKTIKFEDESSKVISGPFGKYQAKGICVILGKTQEQAIKRSNKILAEIVKMTLNKF